MARNLPTALKKDERRDAANAKAARKLLLLVGIHLADPEGRGPSLSRLVEYRRHHLAGPTPGSPEIDEDRQAALSRMSRERGGVQGHYLAIEKLRFALGALRVLAYAVGRGAYNGVALGARDENRICRGSSVRVHGPNKLGRREALSTSCLNGPLPPSLRLN